MRFFNLDLHISVIADIKYIFEKLGHSVDSWCISGHSWVFGKKPDSVEIVNQHTWRDINEQMINDFCDKYEEVLEQYDGFIVTHTPCFSLLYERFRKPIIVVASTRYEDPFSQDVMKWAKFNRYLQDKIDNNIIIPVANNKYDARYTSLFTERDWQVIPSLCEYTNSDYFGNESPRESFLYSSRLSLPDTIKNLTPKEDALPRGYTWEQLASFKGVVHIPYNASTMSIFEQYTANIPLFFPTYEFMKELREKYYRNGVLSELSWNQVFKYPSYSILGTIPDPNDYANNNAMMEWVKDADFYDEKNMPFLQYFNSFEELEERLQSTDVNEISHKMRAHNEERRRQVYEKWQTLLEQLEC